MIDTDKYEGQIEFDYVLKEIEVGVDISEGNYDILRYYRDEYKDLLAEVKRLRLDLASGRITTIVNPNDDHNRTLYVTIEFPDGEVYRGYVEKEGEEE